MKRAVKPPITKQAVVKKAMESLNGQSDVVTGIVAVDGVPFTKDDSPAPIPVLTVEQQYERQTLVKLLQKWLIPAQTTTKVDPERDKASFNTKLQAQTLDDLWRFFDIELPAEIRALMQSKYKDISP